MFVYCIPINPNSISSKQDLANISILLNNSNIDLVLIITMIKTELAQEAGMPKSARKGPVRTCNIVSTFDNSSM